MSTNLLFDKILKDLWLKPNSRMVFWIYASRTYYDVYLEYKYNDLMAIVHNNTPHSVYSLFYGQENM